jgi:hypothetical protein
VVVADAPDPLHPLESIRSLLADTRGVLPREKRDDLGRARELARRVESRMVDVTGGCVLDTTYSSTTSTTHSRKPLRRCSSRP